MFKADHLHNIRKSGSGLMKRLVFVNGGEQPAEAPKEEKRKLPPGELPQSAEDLTKGYEEKGKAMLESGKEKAQQFKVDPEKEEYNDAEYKEYQELEKKAMAIWKKIEPITDLSFTKVAKKIEDAKDDKGQKYKDALKTAYEGLGYKDAGARSEFYVSDTFEGSAPEPVKPFDNMNAKAIQETLTKWMKGNKKAENKENPVVAIMRMYGTDAFNNWNANVDTLKSRYQEVEDKLKKDTSVKG